MLPNDSTQLMNPLQRLPLVDLAANEIAEGAESDDWNLPLSDDEDGAPALPMLSRAASTDQFGADIPPPGTAGAHEACGQKIDTEKPLRQLIGWANKGLLTAAFFVGSFLAGVHVFGANSTVPPVALQVSRQANAGTPATRVDLRPALEMHDFAKHQFEVVKNALQIAQPSAPAATLAPVTSNAIARALDAMPQSTASLYDRVRQVVLENKTEETERLGLGDFAYQSVPDDGSIVVGMEVTYAPFFSHQIIKSVRPIYQRPDGTRYDGPVCGNPTSVAERVVAREGYAIGGAAIKAGMGIDGMQLTFMEIGAEGLNPDRTYLSKWLGINAGSSARMFVNDGRPIIGIAGMRSKDPKSPAFCLCLVTARAGACAEIGGRCDHSPCIDNAKRCHANQFRAGQTVSVEWGGRWWDARVLRAENGRYYITYCGYGPEWNEWVCPARISRR